MHFSGIDSVLNVSYTYYTYIHMYYICTESWLSYRSSRQFEQTIAYAKNIIFQVL